MTTLADVAEADSADAAVVVDEEDSMIEAVVVVEEEALAEEAVALLEVVVELAPTVVASVTSKARR